MPKAQVAKDKKVPLARRLPFQEKKNLRHQAKYRRARSLFKKGVELSAVTGCELFIFVKDEFAKVTYWGTDETMQLFKPTVDSLLQSETTPVISVEFVTPTKTPKHLKSTIPNDVQAQDLSSLLSDLLATNESSLDLSPSTPTNTPSRSRINNPSTSTPQTPSTPVTTFTTPVLTPKTPRRGTPNKTPSTRVRTITSPSTKPKTPRKSTPNKTKQNKTPSTPVTPSTKPKTPRKSTPNKTKQNKTPSTPVTPITSPSTKPKTPRKSTPNKTPTCSTPVTTINNPTMPSTSTPKKRSTPSNMSNTQGTSTANTEIENKRKKKKKNDVYIVEAIEDERQLDDGNVEYFVKWKTWPRKFNTWEPLHHILDKRLIESYEMKKANKKDM